MGVFFIITPRYFSFRARGMPAWVPLVSQSLQQHLQIFLSPCQNGQMHRQHAQSYCCFIFIQHSPPRDSPPRPPWPRSEQWPARVVLAAANHSRIQSRSQGASSLSLISDMTLDVLSCLSGARGSSLVSWGRHFLRYPVPQRYSSPAWFSSPRDPWAPWRWPSSLNTNRLITADING